MSRRNIPRPTIPTKSSNPSRSRSTDQQQQHREKKQKLSEDVPPPSVSQSAAKVSAELERYRTDRDNFRAKFKVSESQLQETDAEVEKLKKELTEARAATSTAEAEVEKMKKEEKQKIKEADAKGYEAGIKRAALEYTQTAHQMVNDELETRLPDFYGLGIPVIVTPSIIAARMFYALPTGETNYPTLNETFDRDVVFENMYLEKRNAMIPHRPGKFRPSFRFVNQLVCYNLDPRATENKPSETTGNMLTAFLEEETVCDWARYFLIEDDFCVEEAATVRFPLSLDHQANAMDALLKGASCEERLRTWTCHRD
ncbi:hypothetical protein RHGRI_006833 [Rhododendron griersonianum]|uniref:Uncharacterized protein n=1 Tax=Rhododendron griersonianum TaxID=479676 RepID=A0AAV6KVS9_9ERIC|nr:hypothetical protein RHGRI_006833 [Rhododendron griersonianum]